MFDAAGFAQELTGSSRSGELATSNRIKVLCSSRENQQSFYYVTYNSATYYWCIGVGYDLRQQQYEEMHADANGDQKVSLEELYNYSHTKVLLDSTHGQEIVRSPQNDLFIIFE